MQVPLTDGVPLKLCHIDDATNEPRHIWMRSAQKGYASRTCYCGALTRCGAFLVNGKQCRRSVKDGLYCEKHRRDMDAAHEISKAVAEGMRGNRRKSRG